MPGAAENYCNYVLKIFSTGLAVAGLVLSWQASQTCEFLSFVDQDGNPPDGAAGPPFNMAIAAHVGIFRYEITTTMDESGAAGRSGCLPYGLRFSDQQDYPSLATAQFCAVIGPCCAVLGAFLILVECCVCSLPGSFTMATLFLLVASGVQGGVFTMIADPVFCFQDSDVDCQQEKGVYWAAAATVLFLVAACVHCASPRFDPFCFNFGRRLRSATTTTEKTDQRTIVVVASTDDTNSDSAALEEGVPDKTHLPPGNKARGASPWKREEKL